MKEMEESYGQQATATLTADDKRQSPTPSDHFRQDEPTISDTGGQATPTPPAKKNSHTLNTNDVAILFDRAGLPRSHRSIERYCKEGKLDSFFEIDEQRYYVTPESAERLIGQLKEIQARNQRPTTFVQPPTPQSDTIRHDAPSSPTPSATVANVPTPKVKELEVQLQTLEIDKQVRDRIIDNLKQQIREDREHFTNRLEENARLVGELKTRLQLESPRKTHEVIEDAQTSDSIEGAPSGAFNSDKE